MKMMVSEASRMFSAISFGVFCRLAPSTRAIIRSMNVSPGLDVIWTTIRSDSTVVPPVTADRSPPDSRMTGADSPVMADSSTDATPSTTSPSPGMTWPAWTTTWSPRVRLVPGTDSSRSESGEAPGFHPTSRRAIVSRLARRSVSAWALPRPSATASARLANTTVSQSQTTMVQLNADGDRMAVYRVSTAPTSTTNMTGFLIWTRGSSFLNASGVDFRRIFGSSRPPPTRRGSLADCGRAAGAGVPGLSVVTDISALLLEHSDHSDPDVVLAVAGVPAARRGRRETGAAPCSLAGTEWRSMEAFCEHSQRERGEVGQADKDEDHADEHADEQRRPRIQRAGAGRRGRLSGQRPGQAQGEDLRREPAEQHRDAAGDLVERGPGAQAGEGRPIVVGLGGVRVHDLGQPVRPGIEDRALAPVRADRDRRHGEDDHRQGEEVQRRVLHLLRPDLLADVLRRPADHQPGHEHRDHGQHQDAVHAGPDPARRDLAQRDVEQRYPAAERRQRIMEAAHRAGGRHRSRRREHRAARRTGSHLHALVRAVRELRSDSGGAQ